MTEENLETTPLDALHRAHGAKMVPFAGYAMPLQYADGIMAEHRQTRTAAGLFDVSHMGQVEIRAADQAKAATALETLVPADIKGLEVGHTRYCLLTDDNGGILDDLMVTNRGDHYFAVVNASRKAEDIQHMTAAMAGTCTVTPLPDRALVAVQGPKAADAVARLAPGLRDMAFMTCADAEIAGVPCFATRSGYTGEDGYEISIAADGAVRVVEALLAEPEVELAGLGARDSLRLEAGLCLYGNDIDTTTTPVEAALTWTIGKQRREEGGFPGADTILRQIADGAPRKRVGLKPTGRAPVRAHSEIHDKAGNAIGEVTSGGFGPTVEHPVAMGYVASDHAKVGTEVDVIVRGKPLPAEVVRLPFAPHRYHR